VRSPPPPPSYVQGHLALFTPPSWPSFGRSGAIGIILPIHLHGFNTDHTFIMFAVDAFPRRCTILVFPPARAIVFFLCRRFLLYFAPDRFSVTLRRHYFNVWAAADQLPPNIAPSLFFFSVFLRASSTFRKIHPFVDSDGFPMPSLLHNQRLILLFPPIERLIPFIILVHCTVTDIFCNSSFLSTRKSRPFPRPFARLIRCVLSCLTAL